MCLAVDKNRQANPRLKRLVAYTSFLIWSFAQPATAQNLDPDASEAAARAALAVLSVAATPNETLSSLSFLSASGDARNLRSTQLRGGFKPLGNGLYLEGQFAYQNYNPLVIFPEIGSDTELDVTWSSIAATLGVGWELPLTNNWYIRPVAHLSLGHVTTDAVFSNFPLFPSRSNGAGAVDGNLNAFGVGASLSVFREAQFGRWEAEYRLRQTFLEFYPINEPQAGDARANSNQTTLFSRYRYPLDKVKLLGRPSKLVLDGGVVLYHGDSAMVLDTDWLATVGVGIEVDTTKIGLPAVEGARVMLNGVIADSFSGFSVGFGVRF
ncbi:hypothetical protein RUM4293_00086 [Ruegeria atlantica]|uniref:Autotransporter domain-containing protein n=1 Tax=Ruegeria atlantica TaxID=81569 RepID=A0A0P1E2V9_9RHOB|nr:hypothetical protein RUM4293_00086 [Ruegeria atlantica]